MINSAVSNSRLQHLLVPGLAALLLGACGGSSDDVGNQPNAMPIAVASVLGADVGTDADTGKTYRVRSGSDILVSGKDSIPMDGPILSYEISASLASGNLPANVEIKDALYERTLTTRVFKVPTVIDEAMVKFTVTVKDADGDEATDSVWLVIEPVPDVDSFLVQADAGNPVANTYDVVAALNLGPDDPPSPAGLEFSFKVETMIEWQPRQPHEDCKKDSLAENGPTGQLCRITLKDEERTYSGSWPAGVSEPGLNPSRYFNARFQLPLPSVDRDDVNISISGKERAKWLEIFNISTARVFQRFTIEYTNNPNTRLLIVDRNGEDTGLLRLAPGGRKVVFADLIRRKTGKESLASAIAYYRLIDPVDKYLSFNPWYRDTFLIADEDVNKNIPESDKKQNDPDEIANAVYLNNYDLGFGRDMYMYTDDCGTPDNQLDDNVYSYVTNYPTLEATLNGAGAFAIVAMEYSPAANEDRCSTSKFVKFYGFAPDDRTGDAVRVESLNFDGRGEKFIPGVCTVCHGGIPQNTSDYGVLLTSAEADLAVTPHDLRQYLSSPENDLSTSEGNPDIDALFMLFDLDSFLFAGTSSDASADQLDVAVNPFNLPAAVEPSLYSRQAQQDQLDKFNKTALFTYLHAKGDINSTKLCGGSDNVGRTDAPIELVNTWYADDKTAICNLASLSNFDGLDFNGDHILSGWTGKEILYESVFARNCRACHIQMLSPKFPTFTTYNEFSEFQDEIETIVRNSKMPLARLTMDRFWVDYDGQQTSAGGVLAGQLEKQTTDIKPIARAEIVDSLIVETNGGRVLQFEPAGDPKTEEIVLKVDARNSIVFFDQVQWWLDHTGGVGDADGCSTAVLAGDTTLTPAFKVVASPCNYSLSVGSYSVDPDTGVQELLDTDTVNINISRIPQAKDLTFIPDSVKRLATEKPLDGYVPGDKVLQLDITGNLDNAGDQPTIVFDISTVTGLPTPVPDENGGVSITLSDALAGVDGSFTYRLKDVDGSESSASQPGTITVQVPAVKPELSFLPPAGFDRIPLRLLVPLGFVADQYYLQRNSGEFVEIEPMVCDDVNGKKCLQYTDTGLLAATSYFYRVRVEKGDDTSESEPTSPLTTQGPDTIPAPASFTAEPDENLLSLSFRWDPPMAPDSLDKYVLDRLNPDGSAIRFELGSAQTTYTDSSGLVPDTTYTYELRALFGLNESNPLTLMPKTKVVPPPESIRVNGALTSQSEFELEWLRPQPEVSAAEFSYRIYKEGVIDPIAVPADGADPNPVSKRVAYSSADVDIGFDLRSVVRGKESIAVAIEDRDDKGFESSFNGDILPILAKCALCHANDGGVSDSDGNFEVTTIASPLLNAAQWAEVREFASYENVSSEPYFAENSRIYQCITSGCADDLGNEIMAETDVQLTTAEEGVLKNWLNLGGLFN